MVTAKYTFHCISFVYITTLFYFLEQSSGLNFSHYLIFAHFCLQKLEEICSTLEALLTLPDEKVRAVLENYEDGQEESRKLIAALKHLKVYSGT